MGDDEECALNGVTVLEGNRLGAALSLGFSALCLLGGLFAVAKLGLPAGKEGASFINVIILGMLGGGAGAWWFTRMSRRPSDLKGELRATRNGVYVRGKRLVARKDIASAYVWPGTGSGSLVRIHRKSFLGGTIDLTVKNVEEGRALLHALGLDATQSASEFTIAALSRKEMRSRLYGSWIGGAAMFAGIAGAVAVGKATGSGPLAALVGLTGFLVYAMMLLRLFKSASVTVGADGVYAKWLWHKRFVAMNDIVRAEVVQGDVTAMNMFPILLRLHLRSGEPIDLLAQMGRTSPFGGSSNAFNRFAVMRADIIAERINEAVLGRGKGTSSALTEWDAGMLARGERAIEEWVAALRGLKDKVQTFREEGGVVDQLWNVLEDAGAAPAQRAAAAVAISPHLDEQGRERLRLAAQATVAPKLRIALEAAAEDDDDRLVRALDDVAEKSEKRASAAP
jgi:hypothetical protein